jgi:hypothetical protein
MAKRIVYVQEKEEDKKMNKRTPNQIVGNIGLYYVCYLLSRQGWNVMPTSRNAIGVDILAYSKDGKRKVSIQVRSLSRRKAVSAKDKKKWIADYLVVVRDVFTDKPKIFVIIVKRLLKNWKKIVNKYGWIGYKKYEKWDKDIKIIK